MIGHEGPMLLAGGRLCLHWCSGPYPRVEVAGTRTRNGRCAYSLRAP